MWVEVPRGAPLSRSLEHRHSGPNGVNVGWIPAGKTILEVTGSSVPHGLENRSLPDKHGSATLLASAKEDELCQRISVIANHSVPTGIIGSRCFFRHFQLYKNEHAVLMVP